MPDQNLSLAKRELRAIDVTEVPDMGHAALVKWRKEGANAREDMIGYSLIGIVLMMFSVLAFLDGGWAMSIFGWFFLGTGGILAVSGIKARRKLKRFPEASEVLPAYTTVELAEEEGRPLLATKSWNDRVRELKNRIQDADDEEFDAALRDRDQLMAAISRLYDCRFETERLLAEGAD
jgi:hypothetical protein